ncbi:MAG: PilZ domain-containing protein [Bdellovibrionales bacterium]|nr:PilZ domain-containing protein [Bdellovibrionales bacterium]
MSEQTDFEAVKSAEEIQSFWDEALRTQASVLVWTRDQDEVVRSHLTVIRENKKQLFVHRPAQMNVADFTAKLAATGTPLCYFSISLARANVFFRAPFVNADAAELKFEYPEAVFKVQRRQDMRLKVNELLKLNVEFQDPTNASNWIKRRIVDLSAGGLSFVAPTEEANRLPVGLKLEEMRFMIEGQSITCHGQVKSVRPSRDKPKKGEEFMVGVNFTGLPAAKNQVIARFVFNETRKIFSSLLH